MRLVQALPSLLVLVLMVGQSEEFGANSGPYDVEVDQLYICEDQGTGTTNINVTLYLGKDQGPKFKKHLHKGSFSVPFTADEITHNMELYGKFYQKKNNDFLLMYNYEGDLCKSLEQIASTAFKSLRKEIGLPEEGCVLPTGNYTFNDWEVPFNLPTPMLEYGLYKAVISFVKSKQIVGCVTAVGVVKRKQ